MSDQTTQGTASGRSTKQEKVVRVAVIVAAFLLLAWLATPQDKLDAASAHLARLSSDKVQLCVDYERSLLKDPDSMKVQESEEASNLARVRYSARNELGGYRVATVKCFFNHETGRVDPTETEYMRELEDGTAKLEAESARTLERARCMNEITKSRAEGRYSTINEARAAAPCWRKVSRYDLD